MKKSKAAKTAYISKLLSLVEMQPFDKQDFPKLIKLLARTLSVFSIGFLLFMIVGHLFGGKDGFLLAMTNRELILFLLFPISTILGLSLAWRWPGIGGLITIIGLIGFHLLANDYQLIPWIDGLAAPGLLFLIYWLLSSMKYGPSPQVS